ncbi:MAG TPA: tetratricopeptide repeat protein [Opitutaceae bacterium]|nr:tetratricopeptide repeat protein [Opitutaceae bacterium]
MSPPSATTVPLAAPGRLKLAAASALIALATLAAYLNCYRAPLVYDDQFAILENASIRHLWRPWTALLSPPAGTTVAGRPVANLTLAVNYALGGTGPWGYHALNVLIHVLGGLTLFGLARRTLAGPALGGRFGRDAAAPALAVALLWSLHPLQTECVTYVSQRVESLMGLFYLLTLYCLMRSAGSPRPVRWQACAVAACLLGMATKEVMATAPLMALLYDRTFIAGSFRKAWRERRGLHLALAATWLPLAALVAATGWSRGRSAGFNAGVPAWDYWLTQLEAVARYAGLSVWPWPLVFDYGPRVHAAAGVLAYALVVAVLAAATLVALWRRPALGFLGAWFFVILAPSSVVPVATQSMAEHRMYLPLAAVAAAAVIGVHAVAGRRSWPILGLLALVLGFLTARRNEVYASELSLWTDTVAKRPENPNARNYLGLALAGAGRVPEAIQQYRAALDIQPAYPGVLNNLGNALDRSGRTPEAIGCYEAALRLEPGFAAAHYNLAKALERSGRTAEAIPQFEEALRIEPGRADGHNDLGEALLRSGRVSDAIAQMEEAVRASPDFARARFSLGNALVQAGRIPEAIESYEEALRIQPDLAEAGNNLGVLLCRTGRIPEGIERIEAAIRAQPDFAQAHFSRGMAMLQVGRKAEAAAEYEKVLKLRPNDPSARRMLELIQASR